MTLPPPPNVSYFQSRPTADASFRFLELDDSFSGCSWHFHPEYQIGCVLSGSGTRVIGDDVDHIQPGEVVLLGANLPHVWRFDAHHHERQPLRAFVIHFDDGFLGSEFFQKPEMRDLKLLMARASLGLRANGETRNRAETLIDEMSRRDGFERLLDLLSLLHLFAKSTEMEPLCSAGFHPLSTHIEIERLRRVCDHVQANFDRPIDRETAAKMAHLSPSAFSRFFKRHTGKTFQEFVNDVRVGQAARMLLDADVSVTQVAMRCGYGDVSAFNRSFRRIKKMSPSEYRQRMAMATSVRSSNDSPRSKAPPSPRPAESCQDNSTASRTCVSGQPQRWETV